MCTRWGGRPSVTQLQAFVDALVRFCEGSSLGAGVQWSAMRGRRLAGSSSPVRPLQPVIMLLCSAVHFQVISGAGLRRLLVLGSTAAAVLTRAAHVLQAGPILSAARIVFARACTGCSRNARIC